ncbi:hypothetical protein ACGFYQ_31150 [Streptomyces sp. NPDC048258]|uniref:hypothetical protein n=1 Tax=Streptomyces sp. NPDC048258 TaxID=3365527 RepID=UPI0037109AAD
MSGKPTGATGTATTTRRTAACVIAGLGAIVTGLVCAPRAAVAFSGGFEGEDINPGVLVTLAFIVIGGALVPLAVWALAVRWSRPWIAVLAALAVLTLGLWGVTEWWTPRFPTPVPGHGPKL